MNINNIYNDNMNINLPEKSPYIEAHGVEPEEGRQEGELHYEACWEM